MSCSRTHRSYLRVVGPLLDAGIVKGMAHITGGGITREPAADPAGRMPRRRHRSEQPGRCRPLYAPSERGEIEQDEMFRAFNMGVGLVMVCAAADAERVLDLLKANGESAATQIGVIERARRWSAIGHEQPSRCPDFRPRL